ncbi:N-6 DNA methylase [Ponticoccus sp. SC6-69]|nr:N-6 DNA methylase [Ponticoccus sp. SC6-9]MBM1227366.1 N-6 DNA methylase [Ponticoccus sp. SC6-15]MBM1231894.1 N-6 DNA methylase [Ponticoccus sp. SC6-38]MBM1236420.1 N-6 DNA methylase [Ponticoccus sp. SC6-45]MBM1240934.1 N-6 DNA methylase [Ponticoccus sp. SC6-49]MBM1245422.1 N-6 DNA methylase [Ponticoccus sp. SC2-64]MBM1254410.1 N-6 DNA methylase [Ponticoccus sp. SC6-33]MBM1258936.1 N-6 DNA methylase [Ponticoccus sp. SC6-60]MBM1263420.1 N-6 DNA methylase [Ponticoccus sp. SC6-31]MBM1267930
MNLFNRKTLKRHIKADPIPSDRLAALEAWTELISSGRIEHLKETALHGQFASKIVEGVLGYHGPAGGADYNVSTEQNILRGSVDLALGRFGGKTPDIVAPFELKGADTRDLDAIMPGRNKSPVQQAWEYAMNARGVKWVLVSNMIELRFYGFGEGTSAYEEFRLDQLTDPEEYARFMLLLSAENLLSGRTADLLKESRREDKDITDSLYQDYKDLRLKLLSAVQEADAAIAPLDAIALAQKILDRVLFIAFAEDTGLLPDNTLENAFIARDPYNPRPVWDNFKGLFRAIDEGNSELKIPRYNGGLFREDAVINGLNLPDDICEGFKTLGEYDFASEVSVTVLGHIFEQSIADVERLQAIARGEEEEPEKATGTSGRRKRDGVVYTPDYIARFIVAETLGTHLREIFEDTLRAHAKKGADVTDYENIPWRKKSAELEAWQAYRDRLKSLRIVDPACGSGVFLIMAFDFMKAELTRVNDKIKDLLPKAEHFGDLLDYVPDSEILTDNLFGVDVNEESIEITKLSLWIKTARRGKVLDSLSGSIRVGDSLIEDSNFAYLDHAFTWETAFPGVFAEGGFDVVLGNPPYVRMEFLKLLKPYLEKRYEVVSDRADLYCYFYERGLRLLKPGGRLGYISSNTFFKTGSGKPLREYLLKEATIESVVDFGDLQIFEGVTTYPAILTMKRGTAPKGHELRFWKVDALPENNFLATWEAAAGPYPQMALGAGSWELENPALRALRDKLIKGQTTLKEVFGPPLMGVKTGLKPAFVIDTPTKERICASDPRSRELIRPLIEGKNLQRWRADQHGHWLIYIPKNRIEIDQYPAIRDWLLPLKDRLEKRATQQAWFELQQAQEAYVPHFEGPKIMWSDVASEARCHLDTSGAYGENTCYFLPCDKPGVVGFLNSKLAWFIVKALTPKAQGGYARFQTQFVEQLPLLNAVVENADLEKEAQLCHELAEQRQKLQQALVRRIPDLCPPDREPKLTTRLQEWWTMPDFATFRAEVKKVFKADITLTDRSDWEDWINRDRAEIARLTAEIAQAEAQIDSIVYDLFDLTEDEIALLEAAT